MANYTMELNDIINLGYDIFNFDYPFYTDDEKIKNQFEQQFISYFYFHEIGCETFSRWQWMLRNKLMTIMPYYSQLYQTQWNQVESNMMLSKNLVETTKRELSNIDDYTSSSKDKLNSQQSQQSQSQSTHSGQSETQTTHSGQSETQTTHSGQSETQTTHSGQSETQTTHSGQSETETTASGSSSAEATDESSNLSDGVLVADLSPENRTGMTKSSSSSTSESESNQTSTQTDNDNQTTTQSDNGKQTTTQSDNGNQTSTQSDNDIQTSTQSDNDIQTLQGHNSLENESTNNSESQSKSNLIEEITFISQGDIGVQTPAYAIREWRSVIININEMIMKDCESLFMQIY